MFEVILKSLKVDGQVIVLDERPTRQLAEESRKLWRKALGDKKWNVNRRPGLDTLDHLALTIVERREG